MFLHGIPAELFEITASFKNTDFEFDYLVMIDTKEFQVRLQLKSDEDTAIYIRFSPVMETRVFFSDGSGADGSEYLKWTNRDEIIQNFSDWYFDSFGFIYQDAETENAKFQID